MAFYKELYAFKPVETTLPPLGQESIPLPPGILNPGGSGSGAGSLLLPPPPPSIDDKPQLPAVGDTPKASPATKLPEDVFAPSATTPEPKKEEPKP
ncbi:hypothetical protein V5E97_11935 [Singulisphaera sp. Ch08]|uniref:Uncharacterized protein n=1 Tax=Singulisphaera sp. Ch08 TaxID=3120278 RepID=A0AAU7CNZ1_9BACT